MYQKAERQPEWFWEALLRWTDLNFYKKYDAIVDNTGGTPWTKWCVGGTTNIVLNCIDRYRETPTYQKTLLIWEGEDGSQREYTYAEIDEEVCRLASALRELGLKRGDVIALFMPNVPETFIAYFAILKIGGIVMPLYSGFGAKALASRLVDGSAKLVFTVDGARRRGQVIPMKTTLDEALQECPEVSHRIVVRDLKNDISWQQGRDLDWTDLVKDGLPSIETEPMGSEDPAILLFTSGTTGRAKGVVYTHVGFMAKMLCDLGLCFDFQRQDRFFWLCDMGWMAGSMVAVVPALHGASFLTADGAPDYPIRTRLWDMVERHKVTYFAVTPTMIRSMMQHDTSEISARQFSDLRVIYSSGEPWTDTPWNWLFTNVCKEKLPIINGTGGTEIGGCILGSTLHHALKPSSFSTAMPAMGADIVDSNGNSVPTGVIGDLVLRKASIGMTSGLWREKERYITSYWNTLPGMWVHGDLAYRDTDGHWYVPGRSDDTMNVAGRRIAPAEVENVLMETHLLVEAAAVAIPDSITGVAMACACVLKADVAPIPETRKVLTEAVGAALGRSFRPKYLLFVSELPKTRSSKIMRRTIRSVLADEPSGDLSALANPEALESLRVAAQTTLGLLSKT
jgi:acetyl-CoA synthetase